MAYLDITHLLAFGIGYCSGAVVITLTLRFLTWRDLQQHIQRRLTDRGRQ